MPSIRLILYVAGSSPRSHLAEANLRRLCSEHLPATAELRVVDVVLHPGEAERHRILTTPTVVRELPEPTRRATGDLGDALRLMAALDLASLPAGDR